MRAGQSRAPGGGGLTSGQQEGHPWPGLSAHSVHRAPARHRSPIASLSSRPRRRFIVDFVLIWVVEKNKKERRRMNLLEDLGVVK